MFSKKIMIIVMAVRTLAELNSVNGTFCYIVFQNSNKLNEK